MRKRVSLLLLYVAILVLILIIGNVYANVETYTVSQSEASLNVQGFNAGNAFDSSFGDSVNLYSGNLIISATDVALPGRNGLGVSLTRQYNSNIFLHRNQVNTQNFPQGNPISCSRNNHYSPSIVLDSQGNPVSYPTGCKDCDVPSSVSGIYTNDCRSTDSLASSWKKAKWLGRGWDMDYGKVKDPTGLFFDSLSSYNDYPKGIPQQGINSLSLVLGNSESGVILPSKFILGDPRYYGLPWGTNLYDGLYSGEIYGRGMGISSRIPEGSINSPGYSIYTALVDGSLSPLTLLYSQDASLGESGIGSGIAQTTWPVAATYTSNGLHYVFKKVVPFCGDYDDIPQGTHGCVRQKDYVNNNPYDWAENPYAGLYLDSITDKAGNVIDIDYWGEAGTPGNPNGDSVGEITSPFIWQITDTLGRKINFKVSSLNINTRLGSIEYPNYRGDIIRVEYVYNFNTEGTAQPNTLLKEVRITDSGGNLLLPSTTYTYDSKTQELTSITYPNGIIVGYTYADRELLTMNYNEFSTTGGINWQSEFFDLKGRKQKHRVVTERRVNIPGENSGNPYVWSYEYTLEGYLTKNPLSITTVTDPEGNRVVHKFLPTTPTVSRLNVGASESSGFDDLSSDSECRIATSYKEGDQLEYCGPE